MILIFCLGLLSIARSDDADCTLEQSCQPCINGTLAGKCAWCSTSSKCLPYDKFTDITKLKNCGKDFHAATCKVNRTTLMLCIGVGAGLLVLAIAGVTIYCCCCHGRKAAKRRFLKEETEFERQRDEINQKHEASRSERQEKRDAIRMKYGLKKGNDYERFA